MAPMTLSVDGFECSNMTILDLQTLTCDSSPNWFSGPSKRFLVTNAAGITTNPSASFDISTMDPCFGSSAPGDSCSGASNSLFLGTLDPLSGGGSGVLYNYMIHRTCDYETNLACIAALQSYPLVNRAWGGAGINILKLLDLTSTASPEAYTGLEATTYIYKQIPSAPAAKYCEESTLDGFTDWYLPTSTEWFSISQILVSFPGSMDALGLSTTPYYWASSEKDASNAWSVRFLSNGSLAEELSASKSISSRVRCVRRY